MNSNRYAYDMVKKAREIAEGKTTSKKVVHWISQMEETYDDPFCSYQPDEKDPPWTKEYLRELQGRVSFGATSKEFFLYMAKVADRVYFIPRLIKMMGIMMAVIVSLFVVVKILIR